VRVGPAANRRDDRPSRRARRRLGHDDVLERRAIAAQRPGRVVSEIPRSRALRQTATKPRPGLDGAFATIAREKLGAVYVPGDPMWFVVRGKRRSGWRGRCVKKAETN
jgi:hypothetical protein